MKKGKRQDLAGDACNFGEQPGFRKMRWLGIAGIVLSISFGFSPLLLAEMRTWQDNTGKFSVQAEFLRFRGDSVVLRKVNGNNIIVPRARLSSGDEDYLQRLSTAGVGYLDGDNAGRIWVPVSGIWKPYHEFLARVNQMGRTGEKRVAMLRWIAGFVPEAWKGRMVGIYFLVAAVLLFPFAYVWILKHEFETNLLWGVAQLTADIGAACLAPFLGTIVTLFYAIGNITTAWRPVMFYAFVTLLGVAFFAFVPSGLYDDLPVKVEDTEFEKDLKELRETLDLLNQELYD